MTDIQDSGIKSKAGIAVKFSTARWANEVNTAQRVDHLPEADDAEDLQAYWERWGFVTVTYNLSDFQTLESASRCLPSQEWVWSVTGALEKTDKEFLRVFKQWNVERVYPQYKGRSIEDAKKAADELDRVGPKDERVALARVPQPSTEREAKEERKGDLEPQ